MSRDDGHISLFAPDTAYASEGGPHSYTSHMTPTEERDVIALGNKFAEKVAEEVEGVWILISGRFTSGNGEKGTETLIKEMMLAAFNYPKQDGPDLTLNVLLDSPGGSLDSAYSTVLHLSAYAKELNVYVPDRAKSASTLLVVGADRAYLSPFGELGPLDTQIPDPRNPANTVSALDCYQSVDYVRDFGFKTITAVLPQLVNSTERRIPVNELLDRASAFALGSVNPMLQTVNALDFGGWGRSLRVGEHYARKLLLTKVKDGDHARAERIASQLVYGYTHHLFPIDYHEAKRIGLSVERMKKDVYNEAIKVIEACHEKDFVGFLSKEQSDAVAALDEAAGRRSTPGGKRSFAGGRPRRERAKAEANRPRALPREMGVRKPLLDDGPAEAVPPPSELDGSG
jgi:hypothetical protein